MVQTLIGAIQQIRSDRVTLLVADQNAKFARRIADRAYIMEKGRITYSGTVEGLWASEEVVRNYLAL
jgi:branched-chain amino acid transport system ATP-binding protein